jgi:hypothetical protein
MALVDEFRADRLPEGQVIFVIRKYGNVCFLGNWDDISDIRNQNTG